MDFEKFITFGIIALVIYLKMKAQKKAAAKKAAANKPEVKTNPPPQVIKRAQRPDPLQAPKPLKPTPPKKISERGFDFHRDIEDRVLDRKITSRELKTQFAEKKQLISTGLLDKISLDASCVVKEVDKESRIHSLIKDIGSKKKIFIINEILKTPYID